MAMLSKGLVTASQTAMGLVSLRKIDGITLLTQKMGYFHLSRKKIVQGEIFSNTV
jgi:proteasome assembly chaperone (PAC2) family protein